MAQENKHGRYDKFDLNKARWICPNCGKDTLMVETKAICSPHCFSVSHSFICEECEFDSSRYGIRLKKKESFNSGHKKLMDIWFYLLVAEKKGWEEGFGIGLKIGKATENGFCNENE